MSYLITEKLRAFLTPLADWRERRLVGGRLSNWVIRFLRVAPLSVTTHPLSVRLEQLEDKARQDALRTVNRMRARMDRLYGADVRPFLYGDRVATVRIVALRLGAHLPVTVSRDPGLLEFTDVAGDIGSKES